jgi:hypothetical protein
MAHVTVKQKMGHPAEKVWALVADFGDISWMPAGTPAEIEGEGPGMARIIGGAIREQLESIDPASRTLVYTIPEGIPFPVTGYRSIMTVTAEGADSELSWSCSFEPDGVAEEQAAAMIEGMYGQMIGWVRERVSSL